MSKVIMNFCTHCGSRVQIRVPQGDNRERHVCESCGTVHYHNPKIVTGCIPEWDGRILLCRRAIEPRYGLWTLPAGFMENGESSMEGAAREAMEEANAVMGSMSLFCVISIPHISQVYMFYRGELLEGRASAGDESLDVGLFREDEIPWDEIAFPVVRETLRLYYRDLAHGAIATHYADLIKIDAKTIEVRHY